jgi:hypothetical protein
MAIGEENVLFNAFHFKLTRFAVIQMLLYRNAVAWGTGGCASAVGKHFGT